GIRPHFPGQAMQLPEHMREGFLSLTTALSDLDALPSSLIHFEANLKHAIQKPEGTIILLDWDEAGRGATVLDPLYHLISYFVSEDLMFDANLARAFYSTYLSKHPLSAQELNHLFDASLFHALRYLIWGDTEKRWKRVQWAVEHRELLETVYR